MSHAIRRSVAIRYEVLLIPALFFFGVLFLFSSADVAAQATFSTTVPLNSNAATDTGEDFYPRMATDGAGNWVVAWESDDSLGGTIGIDCDVLVATSADNGLTWTTAMALNANAATDTGDEFDVHVATDGAGTWMATWESEDDLGGTIGTDVDILVATSVDNGSTWTAPIPVNTNAATNSGGDYVPTTISVGSGVWVVVWHSYDSLGSTIGLDGDILFARSTDDGANWTAPQLLNDNAATDTGDDEFVDVVTDGGANWVAVWDSWENLGGAGTDFDIFVATSADFGMTWTTPRALNDNAATDSGEDFVPTLGRDAAGNWVAVWESTDSLGATIGTDCDILIARSTDNGANWTSPAPLNTNAMTDSGDDLCPHVAVDSLGNWVAVWDSTDDLGGTIGVDDDILSAHSTDSGVTWTTPQAANTTAATDSGGDFFPVIASTGTTTFLMIWFSDDTLGGTVGFDNDIFTATGVAPPPPVIAPISDDMVVDGAPYTGPAPTLTSGTPPITWSLFSGPAGMTIDASTGVVAWPSAMIVGSPHTITIRASNEWAAVTIRGC